MSILSALRRLAAKVDNFLDSNASSAANDAQFAARQRNEFDITKPNAAGAAGGLGNVVRVPSNDGTGVSQAPAIAEPFVGEAMASKQTERSALQGGEALPPISAANASSSDEAWSARQRLIAAVLQARQALKPYGDIDSSTTKKYRRTLRALAKEMEHMRATLPSEPTQTEAERDLHIICAVLGGHAQRSNTFYLYRRSLQFWAHEHLKRCLRTQSRLQKRAQRQNKGDRDHLLPALMERSTTKLQMYLAYFEGIASLDKQACTEAHSALGKQVESEERASSKKLLKTLNHHVPTWQTDFLAMNAQSSSKYRSHTLIQALTGTRPAEFDPDREASAKTKEFKGNGTAGIVVTWLAPGLIRVRIPGAKVTDDAGHVERVMELKLQGMHAWFEHELLAAGGKKRYTVRPQALRDHYERVSAQLYGQPCVGRQKVRLHVTPYCFRHALATSLRWEGWKAVEIAAALGHRSTETQKHYGFRKGGATRPKAVQDSNLLRGAVKTSQEVKVSAKTWGQASTVLNPETAKISP